MKRTWEGIPRSAHLFIPSSVRSGSSAPLLMALHGHGGDAMTTYDKFGWGNSCSKMGWYGLFPTSGTANEIERDDSDLDFLSFILEEALRAVRVDSRRIYMAGFSGGARKTYNLAARESERFAAIAPCSGTAGEDEAHAHWMPETWDAEKLSILHIHGGNDKVVPLEGTPDEHGGTRVGMWEGLDVWADYLNADRVNNPSLPPRPGDVTGKQWVASSGHQIVGLVDPDLAHVWASWANDAILSFFQRVPTR